MGNELVAWLRICTADTQFNGTFKMRFVPNGPYVTNETSLPPFRKIR